MEDIWLTYAKRLQAIATTGLHFTKEDYDRDRYQEIDGIAREMLAQLGSIPVAALVGLPKPSEGYATPRVDVRAAIICRDQILLVHEKSDGRWALPGGYAEIGLTPSENVAKEVREETGLEVDVQKLYRLRHAARGPGEPDNKDYYKLFFLCHPVDETPPAPGPEVHDAAYFAPDALPELSLGRSGPDDIAAAFAHASDAGLQPHSD